MTAERIISKKSERFVNVSIIIWTIISLVISYGAHLVNADMSQCQFCNQLSEYIPAVGLWPKLTQYKDESIILWSYLPLSSFIMLCIYFTFIKDVNYRVYSFKYYILFLIRNSFLDAYPASEASWQKKKGPLSFQEYFSLYTRKV